MRISNQEQMTRRLVEDIFDVRTRDNAEHVTARDAIRKAAIAQFTAELDAKIANLQEEEYLQITYRVDIVTMQGKVRGGRSSQRSMPEYSEWRKAVFTRDGYTCQECNAKGRIVAHHIKHWAKHTALRFDVSNGITLCNDCHAKKHPHLSFNKYKIKN